MADKTAIEWTDASFNPWWGCQKVSPGCEGCYAEVLAHRYKHDVWGPAKTTRRRLFGPKHWAQPLRWNARAEREGRRLRVFCASMADVFEDHPQLPPEREKLAELIERTPHLDWQLLTKRPQDAREMAPWRGTFPPNVWLGTSCEDQRRADERIPALLECDATVRFLSCEPLLGSLDLSSYLWEDAGPEWAGRTPSPDLHWVIVGGESGYGARSMDVAWARDIRDQCRQAGAPVFIKQLGADPVELWQPEPGIVEVEPVKVTDRKGGDWNEWDADLRVREFPEVARCLAPN